MYHRPMSGQSSDVTVFVLAGGKSTRMGRDKAFVEFGGRTLLARAIDLGGSITANVRIVGSREKFGAHSPVVEDIFYDRGPLGGIHAALLASQTELNLMLAVDMPFITIEFLHYLISSGRNAPDAIAVVPRSGGLLQPLCAIYRREFATAAEKSLRAGKYKIDHLFHLVPIRIIEEAELEKAGGFLPVLFRNLNTPEELEAERQRA
jgi:molybdenum cofactor guanylyltransferase